MNSRYKWKEVKDLDKDYSYIRVLFDIEEGKSNLKRIKYLIGANRDYSQPAKICTYACGIYIIGEQIKFGRYVFV